MSLDPQAAAFLADYNSQPVTALRELPLADSRALVVPTPNEPPAVAKRRDVEIPSPAGPIPARLYHPLPDDALGNPSPIIVFFHGGGWVLGNLNAYDGLCQTIAKTSGAAVLSVDYRLAPEHKFPAAPEDCYAATHWIAANAVEHGIDPSSLFVMGDSAGGNLAAAVALMAQDRQGPSIAGQVLLYPITDADFERSSYRENADGYFLTRDSMIWFWEQYLGSPVERKQPYAAPLQRENFRGQPPAIVLTAEFDVLRDEGDAYADALQAADVPVKRMPCPGMIHGFVRRLDLYDRAQEVLEEVGDWIRHQAGA